VGAADAAAAAGVAAATADVRHQRHPDGRRHAGAADRVHGGGAADDGRRAIDLPQTQAKQMNTESKPITVSVTTDGQIFIGDTPVSRGRSRGAGRRGRGERHRGAHLCARRRAATYGAVMKVMGDALGAGYSKIGLITDQEQR
jgi:biopolymer transport protein ExbD